MNDPDYIIVGAGSAGAVLAERLSADGRTKVLLLESGPSHRHPFIAMPKGLGKILGRPSHTWQYQTEESDGIAAEPWVRGRVLGGSSAINGMMYFRGQMADYEDWEKAGAAGWGSAEMARVFKEMEGENGVAADEGFLELSTPRPGDPLAEAFIAAGVRMGVTRVNDLNNPAQEGVGYAAQTIRRGIRISTGRAFLDRAARRSNLRIVTGFDADRVIFNGTRACGVEGRIGQDTVRFTTEGEVVLCAGALNTPAILQRSGVGDPGLLGRHGIGVVADNAGVGQHLLEHRALMLHYDLAQPLGENNAYRGARLLGNTLRYALTRSGPMAAPPYPAAGFFRSRPGLDRPDAEIIFAPYVMQMLETGLQTETWPSFHVFSFPARSRSRGSVRIATKDPATLPRIRPNYLSDPYDREVTISSYRFTVKWMRQPDIARLISRERAPVTEIVSDEDIIRYYKESGSSTFHSCGTCRMGSSSDSVVDARLQVRGVFGLRVADASVFPTMPSCNINGPVMAVGWRAAEIFRAGNG
ncbi:choline dehydrogenase-like flavoprotein [Novosphingobium hassiacum]|uniref:Choline dehydrogenase-like flavoprotein n=1 Tax=Novosphingobium hassiacum TaxID=173676 RepID=A0A7W5ZY44_9SPHN|nr:GMC family oxidoreductase N-terminal domain-containing protein [Novosphingobium hassiacum]MBB3862116.1 choline dehydrogenase-like flavoprotein [Novosphingobium hassiacum]